MQVRVIWSKYAANTFLLFTRQDYHQKVKTDTFIRGPVIAYLPEPLYWFITIACRWHKRVNSPDLRQQQLNVTWNGFMVTTSRLINGPWAAPPTCKMRRRNLKFDQTCTDGCGQTCTCMTQTSVPSPRTEYDHLPPDRTKIKIKLHIVMDLCILLILYYCY